MKFPRATRQHRLFCHITQTWRGKPLTSRETVVELIAATTTIGVRHDAIDTRYFEAPSALVRISGGVGYPCDARVGRRGARTARAAA